MERALPCLRTVMATSRPMRSVSKKPDEIVHAPNRLAVQLDNDVPG